MLPLGLLLVLAAGTAGVAVATPTTATPRRWPPSASRTT